MVYRDDSNPPINHYSLPYDPWDDPDNPPVAPSDDALRQVIRDIMECFPDHGPSRINAALKRYGYPDVPLAVIHGVKAGL